MKTFLLGSVALIALGTVANAADLSPKTYTKAPVAAPAFSWTGFYLSGGAGYGLWESDQVYNEGTPTPSVRMGGRGYFGTVGGGYDWQFAPKWVAGVFGDAQFGDIKGGTQVGTYFGTTKNNLSYAAGARLGYLIAPNALSYVNVGYSHADFTGSAPIYVWDGVSTGPTTPKIHADGWFLGGGVENSFDFFGISAPGWFLKTEYRVAEYGRKTVYVDNDPGLLLSFKPYVQTVSTSLVYRFNTDGTPAKVASAPIYTKAPVAAYNWTGFYLSGGGGYGLWAADESYNFAGGTPRVGGRGYFGVVGGGYDWQFASSWVAGIFADAQFGDIKGSSALPGGYFGTIKNDLSYAAGARLGYLVAPNVLSYVNVGYSHADFTSGTDYTQTSGGAPSGLVTPKFHLDGWFLGGGVENDLNIFGISAPGWFLKTDYRVAEYGRKTVNIVDGGVVLADTASIKPYVQTISTSLVYRFNWSGAPISAKY